MFEIKKIIKYIILLCFQLKILTAFVLIYQFNLIHLNFIGHRNRVLIFGLYFETLLAAFIIYCPGMDSFLKMYPLHWSWWLLPLPWALLIFVYDELRRLLIRKYPTGNLFQGLTDIRLVFIRVCKEIILL